MTDDVLKGNFTVKNNVNLEKMTKEEKTLYQKFKEEALHSIAGSMVFVEQDRLYWDENEEQASAAEVKEDLPTSEKQ